MSSLDSPKQHGRENRKLRKLTSLRSNTFANTATASWADLLNDATRSTSNSSQFPGWSSSKNQESRLQVLSTPDSKPDNAIQPSRLLPGSRFYNGQNFMSNSRTLNGLSSPQSRPVSTKSDPIIPNLSMDDNSNVSQSYSALKTRNHPFQYAQHCSSRTEIIQPRENPKSIRSRRPSQDSHSEDYNTADEAESIAESFFSVAQNLGSNNHFPDYSPGHKDRESSANNNNSELPQLPSPHNRQITTPTKSVNVLQQGQSIAKVFIICCHCGLWHDIPPEVCAELSHTSVPPNPQDLDSPTYETNGKSRKGFSGRPEEHFLKPRANSSFIQSPKRNTIAQVPNSSYTSSRIMHCPWCDHDISSSCCQRWNTVVNLRERHD